MSSDCRFCEIANDPPRWVKVHGSGIGQIVSFKPFGATSDKHRMFVPARHVETVAESPSLTGELFRRAAEWAAEVGGGPCNLVVNSGRDADQTVDHLHVHYVPREANDGLGYRWTPELAPASS